MRRIIDPLRKMGAKIKGKEGDQFAPLSFYPNPEGLSGIHYTLPVASAQIKSCLLLASLFAPQETVLQEPSPSRDHTERMLRFAGVPLEKSDSCAVYLPGGGLSHLKARDWKIPGDPSSAAFFAVAALLMPGSSLVVEQVGVNPLRIRLVDVLRSVGGDIRFKNLRELCGEPVADWVIQSSVLKGDIVLTEADIPALIDEIPILAVAGAFMDGTLTVRGAEELRKKESDRLQAIDQEFHKLGIAMEMLPDGFILKGDPQRKVEMPKMPLFSHHDHRIAMALTILNRVVSQEVWPMEGREWVGISYPSFYQQLSELVQP